VDEAGCGGEWLLLLGGQTAAPGATEKSVHSECNGGALLYPSSVASHDNGVSPRHRARPHHNRHGRGTTAGSRNGAGVEAHRCTRGYPRSRQSYGAIESTTNGGAEGRSALTALPHTERSRRGRECKVRCCASRATAEGHHLHDPRSG